MNLSSALNGNFVINPQISSSALPRCPRQVSKRRWADLFKRTNMNETKRCSHCKEIKSVTEFYIRSDNGLLRSWCKICLSERQYLPGYQEWRREKDKSSKRKLFHKEYAQSEKGKKARRKYSQTTKCKELIKANRQTPKFKARVLAYHRTPKVREYQNKWSKTPKGKANSARKNSKRRTLINNLINDLTAEQWEEIQVEQDYRCAICGEEKELTRDHIIPVSKGGAFTKSNVQGLCRSCNSRKLNRIIMEVNNG